MGEGHVGCIVNINSKYSVMTAAGRLRPFCDLGSWFGVCPSECACSVVSQRSDEEEHINTRLADLEDEGGNKFRLN